MLSKDSVLPFDIYVCDSVSSTIFFRPFLTTGKRELLADYALPAAVLIMSFFGSYVFREVKRTIIYQMRRHTLNT